MQVVEKFISINGEGRNAGQLAVFIRFKGCNLKCSYCDTSWANVSTIDYVEQSPQEIVDYIKSTGVDRVTLTGGEPTLQKDFITLITLLSKEENISVEIETNGATDIFELSKIKNRASFTMDYKCPSSGMESHMILSNFNYLDRSKNDVVKFVVGSIQDLQKMVTIIEQYSLKDKCYIYVSAVFGKIELSNIVDFMKDNHLNGISLQLQMHKFIWNPLERGV
ncbi:MAG: putative 7-carboxy-7-deazaguanine synthase QueE [Oscillospiraceae bacterium]